MPKVNRNGQASIWTKEDLRRFRSQLTNPKHRMITDIFIYTGERIGAICQLKVEDCYENINPIKVRDEIVFPRRTRKRDKKGRAKTREVPTHSLLKQCLEAYKLPDSEWMFPTPGANHRHVTASSVDSWFRKAIERAGLVGRGYSSHSFRRALIDYLHSQGVPIAIIQQITGHDSLDSLRRYIEVTSQMKRNAIELI